MKQKKLKIAARTVFIYKTSSIPNSSMDTTPVTTSLSGTGVVLK